MDEKEIRLKCLELAQGISREHKTVLETAKAYEDYVSGPKGESRFSEKTHKTPSRKSSKVDNDLYS